MDPSANPYSVLTLVAAPAVLTNACTLLATGTATRLARAIDRQRTVMKSLESDAAKTDTDLANLLLREMASAQLRTRWLLRALIAIYTALGTFTLATLASLLGAILISRADKASAEPFRWVALGAGIIGTISLILGTTILLLETKITLDTLNAEADFYKLRYIQHKGKSGMIAEAIGD